MNLLYDQEEISSNLIRNIPKRTAMIPLNSNSVLKTISGLNPTHLKTQQNSICSNKVRYFSQFNNETDKLKNDIIDQYE